MHGKRTRLPEEIEPWSQFWTSTTDIVKSQSHPIFFAQSIHIWLALPQAARLGIFKENNYCCTCIRDLTMDSLMVRYRREKAQHPAGFQPMTSQSHGVCSTTVLQLLSTITNIFLTRCNHGTHF